MPAWKDYGNDQQNFSEITKLMGIFAKMSDNEKGFCNQIRRLYNLAFTHTATGTTGECGSHVFHGGHVVVMDIGRHYADWVAQIEADELTGKPRGGKKGAWGTGSSHYPNVKAQQYEINLPHLGCILFGKTGNQHTWFQNESWSATRGTTRWICHGVLGFGMHKLHNNRQVGALGYSDWSEKNATELILPAAYAPI